MWPWKVPKWPWFWSEVAVKAWRDLATLVAAANYIIPVLKIQNFYKISFAVRAGAVGVGANTAWTTAEC
jgi:hypothetical protein